MRVDNAGIMTFASGAMKIVGRLLVSISIMASKSLNNGLMLVSEVASPRMIEFFKLSDIDGIGVRIVHFLL